MEVKSAEQFLLEKYREAERQVDELAELLENAIRLLNDCTEAMASLASQRDEWMARALDAERERA